MAQGLSVANNLLADQVQLNLDYNQKQLASVTNQLSSGLRISSAADDPSGNAIAANLQTRVDGFNQGSQNVQTANNAAEVALGALTNETNLLQRIRSLAVEAASDVNSSADRANLQAEVVQLLLEVNRISQATNFNGAALLDGSHAGFQAQNAAFFTVTANAALANSASGTGPIPNGTFLNPSAPTNSFVANPVIPDWTVSGGSYNVYNGSGLGPPFPSLPAGSQGLALAAGVTATTTLTGLTPGALYALSFSGTTNIAGFPPSVIVNGSNVTPTNISSITNASYQEFTTQAFTASPTGTAVVDFNSSALVDFAFTSVSLSSAAASGQGANPGFLVATVATGANFGTTPAYAGNVVQGGSGVSAAGFGATGGTVDGTIELQVINTGSSIAVQETFVASASGSIVTSSTLFGGSQVASEFDNVSITLGGVISSADVGATSFIKVSQNVAAQSNPDSPAFSFHSGAEEGDIIQVGIQATNTATLRIANINLALSAATASASLGAQDAIGQIDNALATLLTQQAQLGAVVVRLNVDQDNDNTAATNLQAAESNIRDLNVGQASTEFTKLQILVQVGTSVLAQSNLNAVSVLALFR